MSPSVSRRLFVAGLLAAACALVCEPRARAGGDDVVLVLNAANTESPDLSAAKKIFLGDTTFWHGNVAVHIFVRPSDSPAGDGFFRAISIAPARFKRLWQEKQLSGQGTPPDTIAAVPALVAKVAADQGAIGVALASEIKDGTPGIRVIPLR